MFTIEVQAAGGVGPHRNIQSAVEDIDGLDTVHELGLEGGYLEPTICGEHLS